MNELETTEIRLLFAKGDEVRIDGSGDLWRVIGFAGGLVQLRPVPGMGRLVEPTRLRKADA